MPLTSETEGEEKRGKTPFPQGSLISLATEKKLCAPALSLGKKERKSEEFVTDVELKYTVL